MKIEQNSEEVYIKEICREDIINGTLTIPDGVTIIANPDDSKLFLDDSRELITSIIIPNSVTSIGDYAFYYCKSLSNITIPNSITSIGSWAFAVCKSLSSITIPDSVTSIGEYAFVWCTSLSNITIPDSVTSIGSWAFSSCKSLSNITIPDSVTSIGSWAFYGCQSLSNITISRNIISIGFNALSLCTSLESINVDENNSNCCDIDGILFNKDKTELIYYPQGNKKKTYKIPDTVININHHAFSDCRSLTEIIIPDSVTSIGDNAFFNCTSLTSIKVDEKNTDYCDIDGILFDKDKTNLIQYPIGHKKKSYKIPNSVTNIGNMAFEWCKALVQITIPNSVISIGNKAFSGCKSLSEVTIPDSVISIGDRAFEDCENLTIKCNHGAFAEEYAIENNIPYEIID